MDALHKSRLVQRVPPYMDAPMVPSVSLSILVSLEETAPIHPACECDARSRALMEYAGRRLIRNADC